METPLQIDLQGIDARPDIRAEIDKPVAQLEERTERFTAGRVVSEGAEWPSPHRWALRNHDSPRLVEYVASGMSVLG